MSDEATAHSGVDTVDRASAAYRCVRVALCALVHLQGFEATSSLGQQRQSPGILSSKPAASQLREGAQSNTHGQTHVLHRDVPSSHLGRSKRLGVGRPLHSDTGTDRQLEREQGDS